MICLVAATDLSTLSAPEGCRNWVIAADPAVEIFGHAISVDLDWWSTALADRGLGGGPVTGIAGDSSTIDSGNCQLTRGHVFNLAAGAADDPDTALRLLWHSLAWGSGSSHRKNHLRMDSIAADPKVATQALMEAARLSVDQPVEAYERLAPEGKTVIHQLGPAFFTKYLYFAGRGEAMHPCLILDARVAGQLIDIGWKTMHTRGSWLSLTYSRYLDLIWRWQSELPADASGTKPRADLIERWLFGR